MADRGTINFSIDFFLGYYYAKRYSPVDKDLKRG